MSIQRTGYEILVKQNEDKTQGQTVLIVDFKGQYEDRSDALLMVLDAWDDAMKECGFDPLKSHADFQCEGTLN